MLGFKPMNSPTLSAVPWRRDLLLLTVLFGLLYGFRLGAWPLVNPDEGRYAEIPREMTVSGDWVTPRLDGVKYFEKPPLVYWLVAACYEVLGPGEAPMRLVPALFTLAGVLLAYGCARRMQGREAGLIAAGVLGTALLFMGMGRVLTLDTVVSVLMAAALACFILGVREAPGWRRRWFFHGLYASAALATLTKGLIGFLVTGAVMFFWLLLFNQWKRLRPFYLPTGALLFVLVAVPWHWLVATRNPDWAWFYFVHEHWLRFTTKVHGRYQPWWFFLPILWFGFFPWTGFIWPSLRMVWREWRAGAREAADLGFFVVWIGFVLLFYSLSDSKLVPYILPVFPAVAVLIGVWLARTRAAGVVAWRWAAGIFAAISLLFGAAFFAILGKPKLAQLADWQLAAIRPWLFALAVVMVLGAAGGVIALRRRSFRLALGVPLATGALFLAALTFIAPVVVRPSTKPLAEIVRREFKPGDQIFSYHEFFHDFPFYSGHLTGTVAYAGELEFGIKAENHADRFINDAEFRRRWLGPARVFVIVRKKDIAVFRAAELPAAHLWGETRGQYLFSNHP
jgi:4-amino-4-deoxy-L-arabinose transferase-like glycosyltransferase